jgi:DNA-binding transcriptional ArsR family regulator
MKTVKQKPDNKSIFHVLSNPKRINILLYLDRCIYATNKVIAENTRIPQPQVTSALKKLQNAGLITEERAGKRRVYLLNPCLWNKVKDLLQ